MRDAFNQFSYDVTKIRAGKIPTKKLCILEKKLMIYYFCVFTIVGIVKVGPGANVSNAVLLNTALLGSVVQIFAEHGGDNLQFYLNFAVFSTLGR